MSQPEPRERQPHWADRIAGEVAKRPETPVLSTGISPSGEIHIGNMREVLTADAVYRALRDAGASPRFNYVADNFDPLRRVYPFLDRPVYEPLIGRPLSEIPCPCGRHPSYSEHFLEPFLSALATLRVDVEVERSDRMYASGRMTPWVLEALAHRDRIATILADATGKQVAPEWTPFNPLCPSCRRIDRGVVTGFSRADATIDYRCGCGAAGTQPIAGGGKLVWRIDWPARWMLLGVTVEPFGKDHATRGGSYDTGARVVEEVFGGRAPHPVPYEWIRLKGQGDMSSSKGNVLSIGRVLDVVPPDALRYLVIRERPQRTIDFDPGLPLLKLVDELDDAAADDTDPRSVELSRAAGFEPVGVPFKHLVVVAQAARFDPERTLEILHRTGYPDAVAAAVTARLGYARRWLETFAPEDVRFEVAETLPPAAAALDDAQRAFLAELAGRLREGDDGEAVHAAIYAAAAGFEGVKPGRLFQAIYLALLGKTRGPRAGWFVALLGAEYCARRFREAAGDAAEEKAR